MVVPLRYAPGESVALLSEMTLRFVLLEMIAYWRDDSHDPLGEKILLEYISDLSREIASRL